MSPKTLSRLLLVPTVLLLADLLPAQKGAMTFDDVMRFRAIRSPSISEDGQVIAYQTHPDRGDDEVLVQDLGRNREHRIPLATNPEISSDGRWVKMTRSLSHAENAKKGKDKEKPGLVLLDLESGEQKTMASVKASRFSKDGHWLAVHHNAPSQEDDNKPEGEEEFKRAEGTALVLHSLAALGEERMEKVDGYLFDPESAFLVYAVTSKRGHNGLFYRALDAAGKSGTLHAIEGGRYSQMGWNEQADALAFIHSIEDPAGEQGDGSLMLWTRGESKAQVLTDSAAAPEGWVLPKQSRPSWSKDGKRIFFGYQPAKMAELVRSLQSKDEKAGADDAADPFDQEAILEARELDVWHWNDPLISTQQKNQWNRVKNQTYRAVYHREGGKIVPLADEDMPQVEVPENSVIGFGRADTPYRKEITWNGRFADIYLVDIRSGKREKALEHQGGSVSISPRGEFLAFYREGQWHLRGTRSRQTRSLTAGLKVPFANEDHDFPSDVPGYGVAGWLEDESAVLIYDKYDIWQFPTVEGEAKNITAGAGREAKRIFRIVDLDPEREYLGAGEELLLSSYQDLEKGFGFYRGKVGGSVVEKLLEADKRFRVVAKAKSAERLLYTREDYDEFPDLWVGDMSFAASEKVSNLGAQTAPFAWGQSELVNYEAADGSQLQGVLIKPGNYQPGERYPVLVYYYRFFTQRLHEFNPVVINHRPCFPYYASNGYAVFLPDIRFEVGHPGSAATRCLLPGINKIVEMGVADPDAIGLHGHSWSGYQSAFVITQTDAFACAIAGAPVSNMTSAYSGIRWASGMARQFQYEKTQSRIGGTLWEVPELYIENSPVFFADRISTPLLIQFGDEDGAVPWYQGIELYLALRRLGKDCVFLQYRGEPHHLQKYANKLDYSIKMREYLDHYLKGKAPARWIEQGMPYAGK